MSKVINAQATSCHRPDIALICRHWKRVKLEELCSINNEQKTTHRPPPPRSGSGSSSSLGYFGPAKRRRKRQGQGSSVSSGTYTPWGLSEVFEYTLSPEMWGALDSGVSISRARKLQVLNKVLLIFMTYVL